MYMALVDTTESVQGYNKNSLLALEAGNEF